MKRRSVSMLLAVMILGFAGSGPPAHAQDDGVADEEQPAQRRQGVFASDEEFDQWFDSQFLNGVLVAGEFRMISGQRGNAGQIRDHLDAELAAKVRQLNRTYGLTAEEMKKLTVAGKHDIQRYFDAIEEMRKRLGAVRDDRGQFVDMINARHRDILKLRQGGEALFGAGSLLAKTLGTTLANNPADSATRKAQRSRDRATIEAYRSRVDWVVSQQHDWLMLTAEQHRRLVDLIAEETPPPRRYGRYDGYAVMFRAAQLREPNLERFLSQIQRIRLDELFRQARSAEKLLIAEGYLAPDDPDENRPGAGDGAKRKPADVQVARPAPVRRGFTGR